MGRKQKPKKDKYKLDTEHNKELIRQYDFWKGLYVQRKLHNDDPTLVAKGLEAINFLHRYIDWPFEVTFEIFQDRYNEALFAWSLQKFSIKNNYTLEDFPLETRSSLDVLFDISKKYGYFAYDLLFMLEIEPLLLKIETLNQQGKDQIPVQELVEKPLSIFFDIPTLEKQRLHLDVQIDSQYFSYEKEMQNTRERILTQRLIPHLKGTIEMSVLEQYDFTAFMITKKSPKLQLYHYSLAIGLWIWDHQQKHHTSLINSIKAYQDKFFTFALPNSEPRVFSNLFSIAKRCIQKGEVLPLK